MVEWKVVVKGDFEFNLEDMRANTRHFIKYYEREDVLWEILGGEWEKITDYRAAQREYSINQRRKWRHGKKVSKVQFECYLEERLCMEYEEFVRWCEEELI